MAFHVFHSQTSQNQHLYEAYWSLEVLHADIVVVYMFTSFFKINFLTPVYDCVILFSTCGWMSKASPVHYIPALKRPTVLQPLSLSWSLFRISGWGIGCVSLTILLYVNPAVYNFTSNLPGVSSSSFIQFFLINTSVIVTEADDDTKQWSACLWWTRKCLSRDSANTNLKLIALPRSQIKSQSWGKHISCVTVLSLNKICRVEQVKSRGLKSLHGRMIS